MMQLTQAADLLGSACPCRFMKLALMLLHEQQLGQASRLAPYLDYLPKTFNTPFSWSDQELRHLRYPFVTQEVVHPAVCRWMKCILSTPYTAAPRHFLPHLEKCINDDLYALLSRMSLTSTICIALCKSNGC